MMMHRKWRESRCCRDPLLSCPVDTGLWLLLDRLMSQLHTTHHTFTMGHCHISLAMHTWHLDRDNLLQLLNMQALTTVQSTTTRFQSRPQLYQELHCCVAINFSLRRGKLTLATAAPIRLEGEFSCGTRSAL